uniref:Uncharacterized protein n=1 Tax=Chenopodium quinoa TaxID=63459 RepID=A0A803L7F2_CHEQI
MEDVLNDEEMLWFQKSRMVSICDGDRNTRYFHLSTVIRRRHIRIETIQNIQGEWVTDSSEVRSIVQHYWQGLFSDERRAAVEARLLWDYFPEIASNDFEKLLRPVF